MKSNFSRKLASIKVKIEIKEGRVSVSGREYFADHVYAVGFENGLFDIGSRGFNIEINFRSLPKVYTEGSLIKIGNVLDNMIIEAPVIKNVKEKGNDLDIYIENADLKIRQENGSTKIVVEGVREYTLSKARISIFCKENSIANVMTRPFLSIWIYCGGSHKIEIKRKDDLISINIARK